MKTFAKRFVLPAVMALMSLGGFAATPGVTFLFSNGQKASFAFASKPEIRITVEGITISSTDASTVSYAFAHVQKFYFEDDVITGIQQVEDSGAAKHPVFNYVGDAVTVSGMAAGECLSVVTLSGSQVSAIKADNAGNACVDLSGAPAGVYVVSTGSGVSFKLLKQ